MSQHHICLKRFEETQLTENHNIIINPIILYYKPHFHCSLHTINQDQLDAKKTNSVAADKSHRIRVLSAPRQRTSGRKLLS